MREKVEESTGNDRQNDENNGQEETGDCSVNAFTTSKIENCNLNMATDIFELEAGLETPHPPPTRRLLRRLLLL